MFVFLFGSAKFGQTEIVGQRVELRAAASRLYMVPEQWVVRNCALSGSASNALPLIELSFLASAFIPPSPDPFPLFFVYPLSARYSSRSQKPPFHLPPCAKSPAAHTPAAASTTLRPVPTTTATTTVVTTSGATAPKSHNHLPRSNDGSSGMTAIIRTSENGSTHAGRRSLDGERGAQTR